MKTLPGFTGYDGPRIGSHFTWRTTEMQTETSTTAAPAEKRQPKITLEPIKGDTPNKLIRIDGKVWAKTTAKSMSRYGVMYSFLQLATGGQRWTITVPAPSAFRPGELRKVEAQVRSHSKNSHRNNGDERPTEQRIVDKVIELIEAGHLLDPDEAQRRIDAQTDQRRTEREKRDQERREAFRVKAIEAIFGKPANYPGHKELRDQVERVVDAMEWAQSQ